MVADDNDLGLKTFLAARERAVRAASPAERQAALAEALLAAGAILHLVEDAGDPAHVHDDLVVDLFDHGAPLATWAAARYGRVEVPRPAGPARDVAHLADLIHAADGSGLADRTARRFFSTGVLEGAVAPTPGLPPLVAPPGLVGYLLGEGGIHLARFRRDSALAVHWGLDDRCLQDYAAALLPEAGQAALSALEHLFRGELAIDGGAVKNGQLPLGAGEVTLLAEGADGARRVVASQRFSAVAAGAKLLDLPAPPSGAKRWAIVFRGVDGAGDPIVVSAESDLAPAAQ
jgi:hypothetical protein